jgi:hypothetical protein
VNYLLNCTVGYIIVYMNDCILSNIGLTEKGYCRTSFDGVRMYSHRYWYIKSKGEIPEGLVLDHLCRVRNCINPEHLEAVTAKVNTQRGIYATKTHCIKGHEYTPENTYTGRQRRCRICTLASVKIYDAKRRSR